MISMHEITVLYIIIDGILQLISKKTENISPHRQAFTAQYDSFLRSVLVCEVKYFPFLRSIETSYNNNLAETSIF